MGAIRDVGGKCFLFSSSYVLDTGRRELRRGRIRFVRPAPGLRSLGIPNPAVAAASSARTICSMRSGAGASSRNLTLATRINAARIAIGDNGEKSAPHPHTVPQGYPLRRRGAGGGGRAAGAARGPLAVRRRGARRAVGRGRAPSADRHVVRFRRSARACDTARSGGTARRDRRLPSLLLAGGRALGRDGGAVCGGWRDYSLLLSPGA